MANDAPITDRRPERVLAFMLASAVGLSIISIFASFIGGQNMDGIWPTIRVLPLVGLPLAAVFLVALVVVSSVRRGRESKDARK